MGQLVAMAIAAHPDDIEFMMAGTLLLLKDAGAQIHMWNLANGSCGSMVHSRDEIIGIRMREAEESAKVAGAINHPPLVNDIEILYTTDLIREVASRIRQVKPSILLIPSAEDYMEDHMTTARLAVTGAFCRNMPNFDTDPPTPICDNNMTIYHALPYGLRDGLRRRIRPGQYVDISTVVDTKKSMLEQHRSQKDWLDKSQGVGSYTSDMVRMAQEVGIMSTCFDLAEGWRRHSHLGFSAAPDADPLAELLGSKCYIDPNYEMALYL